ncbi:MAG: histidine triad nucleotide-binding protein [Candidatus Margulisiibacteriota bacterium]
MPDCVFCKIINKEIPSKIIYEDERVLAFHDLSPRAPTHILIIPKQHVATLAELTDYSILPDIYRVINKLAVDSGLDKKGFRVVVNNGKASGQAVFHLHFHLLGGRDFNWPPG